MLLLGSLEVQRLPARLATKRICGHMPSCHQLLVVLWSQRDDLEDLYGDPLVIWRRDWADVHSHRIDSAHQMAEEVPEELVQCWAASSALTRAP
jgi:hypothetical protein